MAPKWLHNETCPANERKASRPPAFRTLDLPHRPQLTSEFQPLSDVCWLFWRWQVDLWGGRGRRCGCGCGCGSCRPHGDGSGGGNGRLQAEAEAHVHHRAASTNRHGQRTGRFTCTGGRPLYYQQLVAFVSATNPLFTIMPASVGATDVADKIFCRRPVNQSTPSGRVVGGWACLTSVTPAVIGRPSKNVALQFGEMSARRQRRWHLSASVNMR